MYVILFSRARVRFRALRGNAITGPLPKEIEKLILLTHMYVPLLEPRGARMLCYALSLRRK